MNTTSSDPPSDKSFPRPVSWSGEGRVLQNDSTSAAVNQPSDICGVSITQPREKKKQLFTLF